MDGVVGLYVVRDEIYDFKTGLILFFENDIYDRLVYQRFHLLKQISQK